MKKKQTKFLDIALLTCWSVGVLMIAIFLGMTATYASCSGDLCDRLEPKCSETIYYKPGWSVVAGCFKTGDDFSATNQGRCYAYDDGCTTCLCRPEENNGAIGQPCRCRE